MLPRACADLSSLTTPWPRPEARTAEELLVQAPRPGGWWWVKVRHAGLSVRQVQAALGRAGQLDAELVTCAGPRERLPLCIQWFAVPAEPVEQSEALRQAGSGGRMKVLEIVKGDGPLAADRVAGLRWKVRLPKAGPSYGLARAIVDRLRREGCPNWMPMARGEDRFARWGRRLAAGKRLPEAVRRTEEIPPAGVLMAAFQANLFNRYLAGRIETGTLIHSLPGDLLLGGLGGPAESRRQELVTDPQAADVRIASGEAAILGPLFGGDLPPVSDQAAEREAAFLSTAGLNVEDVARLRGGRRPLTMRLQQVELEVVGADLSLALTLPADGQLDGVLAELLGRR